jgi:hypothetical protein
VRSAGVTTSVRAARAARGFTIVELLLSLIMSLVIITSATAFAINSWETRRGWTLREGVDRNARFLGLAIARDAQEAGIDIESTPVFGTLGTFGDTLSIVSVPYEGNEPAPIYRFDPDDGAVTNPLQPGNVCGDKCLKFQKDDGTFDIDAGDVVRLQVGGERRLLMVTGTADAGTHFTMTYAELDRLMGRPAGLGDTLLIDRFGTAVQKVKVVAYWWDANSQQVYRAERFSTAGAPIGGVIADGVGDWQADLVFQGDVKAEAYDGFDTDSLNDGNRIVAVEINAKVLADRTDPSVNDGQRIYRYYTWRVAPRNLQYEKNRL